MALNTPVQEYFDLSIFRGPWDNWSKINTKLKASQSSTKSMSNANGNVAKNTSAGFVGSDTSTNQLSPDYNTSLNSDFVPNSNYPKNMGM